MTFQKISETTYIGDDGAECLKVVYEARALRVTVYNNPLSVIDVVIGASDPEAYTQLYCDGSFTPKFSIQYVGLCPAEAIVTFPETRHNKVTIGYLTNKIIPEINTTLTALNALLEHVRKEFDA